MPSAEHEAIVERFLSQPRPEEPPDIEQSRQGFGAQMREIPPAPDVEHEAVDAGGVPAEWVSVPGARRDRAVLYLHGGAYVLGSPETHRGLASRVARAAGMRCLSLDYRLAPEHPFPAALEDALAAWRWLRGSGLEASDLALVGDSAGGGLALATLVALRDAGEPLPAGAACMSPWTDLALEGVSAKSGQTGDPLLTREGLLQLAGAYLGGGNPRDPLASPVYADLAGLPPLLLQAGTREILLDDATRVAERARAAGVSTTLELGEGLIHAWQLFGDIPESRESLRSIGEFVREHTGAR